MERATWLEPARREARALVAARLAAPLPPLPRLRRARSPVLPIVCVLALVGAAWASRPVPQILHTVDAPAPSTVHRPTIRVVPRAQPRRAVVTRTPAPVQLVPPTDVDEPLGEVIEGKRPVELPPLFDVAEYKSRGVMVPPK